VELKKPWIYLEKLAKENPAKGGAGENLTSNELWWSLLEKVRTYYQQNPE
jgi:hypothetical protein